MKDVLTELTRRVTKRSQKPPVQPGSLGPVKGIGNDPITVDALYPRWANFIKPNDILITETGSSAYGLAFALLPKGAKFYNQTVGVPLDMQLRRPLGQHSRRLTVGLC
jgi:indolepyruvate decarboxylase